MPAAHVDRPAETALAATRQWVEQFVVGLQLCPFARRELEAGRVRFVHTDAANEEALITELQRELDWLQAHPETETTLLIHPQVLQDFSAYNQFLDLADALLLATGYEGQFQLASFHPDYQFAGTQPEDAENFSNRSPCPMLHILREGSVEAAVAAHPDVEGIPEQNIAQLRALGAEHLHRALEDCWSKAGDA